MPSANEILQSLSIIANEWRVLACGWHFVFATLGLAVLGGARPSRRLVAMLLISPVLSISVLAWASANPFNGIVFAILAIGLASSALSVQPGPIAFGSRPMVVLGAGLIGFGWTYPHFLEARGWTSYLYEAPLGLIPCPTLSMLVGVSLVWRSFDSSAWASTLAAAAIAYGLIGVFALGVTIDGALLAGGLVLGGGAAAGRGRRTGVPRERLGERRGGHGDQQHADDE
jgi:hypothetical protein